MKSVIIREIRGVFIALQTIFPPDLTEIVTTFFTGYPDLTRYLSAFCALTPRFFSYAGQVRFGIHGVRSVIIREIGGVFIAL
jgi:hypothetical protein